MDTLLRLKPDECKRLVESFSPAHKEADVEKYLKSTAIKHIRESKSMTYLAIDVDSKKLLGYYTLALLPIRITENDSVSKSVIKKMRGTPDLENKGEKKRYTVITYLIGQLGRTSDANDGFGRELLNHALQQIEMFSMRIGGKVIRIDCKDELIGYYEKCGFNLYKKVETRCGDTRNILIQYIERPDFDEKS